MNDIQLQDSVIRRLEIIGEAASRVSTRFRERYNAIPWGRMIGMRNRVIHGYGTVDLEIVRTTVQDKIPELLVLIEPLIPPKREERAELGCE